MTTDMTGLTGIVHTQTSLSTLSRISNNVVSINKGSMQTSPPQTSDEKINLEGINQAASYVNNFVKTIDRNLEFSVDETSGRVIITVREPETGKVVRQIPPEELLVIAKLVSENFDPSVPSGVLIADRG